MSSWLCSQNVSIPGIVNRVRIPAWSTCQAGELDNIVQRKRLQHALPLGNHWYPRLSNKNASVVVEVWSHKSPWPSVWKNWLWLLITSVSQSLPETATINNFKQMIRQDLKRLSLTRSYRLALHSHKQRVANMDSRVHHKTEFQEVWFSNWHRFLISFTLR